MGRCSILEYRHTYQTSLRLLELVQICPCPEASYRSDALFAYRYIFLRLYVIFHSSELLLRQLFISSTVIQRMTDRESKTFLMDCVSSFFLSCYVYRALLNVGSVGNCLATKASSGNQRTTPLRPRETPLPVRMMSSPDFDRRRKGDIWLRAACHLHNERSLCKP